jgi:Protein of unknown function (DUF3499)
MDVLADHIDVIYPSAMRGCAKTGCEEPASASVGLRYEQRIVVVGDLQVRYDPNLLELCTVHADRMSPPRGWVAEDRRGPVVSVPEAPISLPRAAPDAVAPGA